MCGIAGVVGSFLTDAEKAVFCDLLRINTLRGSHSTGVLGAFRWGKQVDYMVAKTTRNAVSALDSPPADLKSIFARKDTCSALIGHTRAATKGSIKLGNAHPFIFPRVIGVHNGTIHSDLIYQQDYETDSEALYRDINDRGLIEALRQINKGYPNYTLVMVDRETDDLVAIRNPRRPFHFTFSKSGHTMFFSSEAGALRYILGRHNMLYKDQVFPQLKEDYELRIPIAFNGLDKMTFTPLDVKPKVISVSPLSGIWPGPVIDYTRDEAAIEEIEDAAIKQHQSAVVAFDQKSQEHKPPITLASTVIPNKNKQFSAAEGMSKKARKKFQKALRKQARISAKLAKEAEEEAESTETSDGFTPESTPSFLKGAGIKASNKVKHYLNPVAISDENKATVLHQSALFDDVQDCDVPLAVLDKMGPQPAGTVKEYPFDDPPFDPIDPDTEDEIDPTEDAEEGSDYVGAYGVLHSKEEMQAILAKGCQWCGQQEELQFHERVEWIDKDGYVCAECMETNEDVMMYFGRKPEHPRIH